MTGGRTGGMTGAERRLAMRKAVFQLVLGIVLLDAAALGIWFGAGIDHARYNTRMGFTVVWTIATALTVAFLLRRVRKIRMTG